MYQRGLSYAKQGDMDKAIHDVEQAVSMKPNYKIARRLLALLYKEAKQIQKSKEQLLYILTNISPDDKTVQDELNAL
jgi:Tfp pilus assembly protein PilF